MIDLKILIILIASRSSKRESERLRLLFLIFREREKLKKLVIIKLDHVLIDEQERILNFQDSHFKASNFIKYLHSHVRFFMNDIDDNYFLKIESFSKKSFKSISNSELLKIFCEVFIDTTQNKR